MFLLELKARQRRARLRSKLQVKDNESLILFVGRLKYSLSLSLLVCVKCCTARLTRHSHQKNPQVLAFSLKQLTDLGHTFKAVIVGDGNQKKWVRPSFLTFVHAPVPVPLHYTEIYAAGSIHRAERAASREGRGADG